MAEKDVGEILQPIYYQDDLFFNFQVQDAAGNFIRCVIKFALYLALAINYRSPYLPIHLAAVATATAVGLTVQIDV